MGPMTLFDKSFLLDLMPLSVSFPPIPVNTPGSGLAITHLP